MGGAEVSGAAPERKLVFPFTAVVGQEKAKLALLCCAVDPTIGGVLLSGEKGTGKSTLVRALSQVLPEIEVVKGCPFNCNPHNPLEMCDTCYSRLAAGEELEVVKRRMRVVDLPLSITVDRLVGTLDIRRALKEGIRALQPGLLAEANRNILYIDEVNLLDDYVADVLLDAAAMGWNIIEREGLSFRHPARFILVGSMNPEEGELRPQLLDRFGLFVQIEPVRDPDARAEIVRRVEEFHADPISFYRRYEAQEEALRRSIMKAKELIREVTLDDDLLKLLVKTIIDMGIGTHRAEIVTAKTAKAIAALDGRRKVTLEDLEKAMELALPHRLRSKPLQPPPRSHEPKTAPPHGHKPHGHEGHEHPGGRSPRERPEGPRASRPGDWSVGNRELVFKAADVDVDMAALAPMTSGGGTPRGRGSRAHRLTVIGYPQGHPVSYTLPTRPDQLRDIDLVASINAAAARLRRLPLSVGEEDLRVRVRKCRAPRLIAIVLDSSGSMGILKRMSIAKGIAQKLIRGSYVRRDFIALITFRGLGAEVVVPPTRKYETVLMALEELPTGGRTPLPAALQALLTMTRAFKMKHRDAAIKAILITDGKANVPLWRSVEEDLRILAAALARSQVELEIYDTKPPMAFELAPSYIGLIAEFSGANVHYCD